MFGKEKGGKSVNKKMMKKTKEEKRVGTVEEMFESRL